MAVTLGGSMRRRRGNASPRTGPSGGNGGGWLRFLGWFVGLALVGWGLGFGYATLVLFPAPSAPDDLVTVPDLQGKAMARARDELGKAGLTLGSIDSLRHPSVDSGRVVGQAPLPGQLAQVDAPVRVTVSMGAERRAVPDLARVRGDRAVRVLQATGFAVTVDSVQGPAPRGRVLEIDPPAGTELALPGQVRVTVSRGPARVAMPGVLGMTERAAADTLAALGLTLSAVDTVFRFGRDQGLVVEQAPAAAELLERGSAVRLSVGRPGG